MSRISAGRVFAAAVGTAAVGTAAVGTAACSAAHAQQPTPTPQPAAEPAAATEPAVNPGRPTVTDVANLTVPGYLEMESGLNSVKGGAGLSYQFSQAFLLKLTDRPGRTEFRLSTDGYVIQKTSGGTAAVTTGTPNGSTVVAANTNSFAQGFGDTTFGVQHLFVAQTPKTYNLAARLEYKLPTGGSRVGTGKSDYNALLLASKDYTDKFHADYNLGQALLGRPNRSSSVGQTFAPAAFSYQVPHGFTVQTEFYGFSGSALNGTNIVNGYGFTYTPRPSVVYDGYIGFGLTRSAPKYTVTVGRTFFLERLF